MDAGIRRNSEKSEYDFFFAIIDDMVNGGTSLQDEVVVVDGNLINSSPLPPAVFHTRLDPGHER